MAKFKSGDRVRVISSVPDRGRTGIIFPNTSFNPPFAIGYPWRINFDTGLAMGINAYADRELEKVTSGGQDTMEKPVNAKYGVNWMEDEDPTEFFKTEAEAKARIELLLKDEAVQKDSIYLFEVGKVSKVEVPTAFKLVEVVKRAVGRPRKK